MSIEKDRKIRILAIETSCDETSASLCESKFKVKSEKLKVIENIDIKSNIISSQVKLHAKYGGVYPELASREHIKNILHVIEKALSEASIKHEAGIEYLVSGMKNHKSKTLNTNFKILDTDFDAIAVTVGPGLIGSLLVGINTAKTLAYTLKKPIYAINHLEGHIYSCFTGENFKIQDTRNKQFPNRKSQITNEIPNSKIQAPNKSQIPNSKSQTLKSYNPITLPPYNPISLQPEFPLLALIVSGGHTSLVLMKDHFKYEIIGETLDDAVGESFDKVAKMLDLGYPGGPAIAKMAMEITNNKSQITNKSQISNLKSQNENSKFKIKFPRPMIDSGDFNFSFSGIKTSVLYTIKKLPCRLTSNVKRLICNEFQDAVVETLVTKTLRAAQKYKVKSILLCGGV